MHTDGWRLVELEDGSSSSSDRLPWVWLSRLWPGWQDALEFVQRIEEAKIAPRSPWQNPYVERVIGSIRRDALDHVIVLNERHLRRVLRNRTKVSFEFLIRYRGSCV